MKARIYWDRGRNLWMIVTRDFLTGATTLVEALNLVHYGNTQGRRG